jgi:hypothetical protein
MYHEVVKILELITIRLIIISVGLSLFSCKKEIETENILVKIDDVVITAEDFKHSFEYAFAPTKIGPNPRKFYLNYLINELLIAREGYRLGYHNHPYVKNRVKQRKYDNLLEAFVIKHIRNKVKIPEEDIQEAVKKGSIKFRLIILPFPSLNQANGAYNEASKTNLEDYIETQLKKQEMPLDNKKYYESDWLNYLDVPPNVLVEVQNLEIGKTSEPIPYGNGYALIQVLKIHREGIQTDDLARGRRRKEMEARLYNIAADKLIHSIMDSLLTPLNIRVNSKLVKELSLPLYQWFQDTLPKSVSVQEAIINAPDSAKSYMHDLKKMLDKTMVTYNDGEIKVKDYFDFMNYNRRTLHESKSVEDFENRLLTEIGHMMKNDEFIKIAKKDGYEDSTWVKRDVRNWEQKWTYEIYRMQITKKLKVSEEEMHDYFKHRWRELDIANVDTTRFYKYEDDVYNAVAHEKYIAKLDSALAKYKEQYSIYINEKLLNEIELHDDPKSIRTSFFVRRNFNWQEIVPIVDMKWLSF